MSLNVLVPLDGSDLAERALPTAVSLVKRRHGRLELAFVHEPVAYHGMPDEPWSSMTESMQHRYVTDKAGELSVACAAPVGHVLLHGDIEREICARAHAMGADVIVMSTHGNTGLSRALAGSVADAVVRESSVPVLLLRQPDVGVPAREPPLDFEHILIPIDGSAESRRIFDAAAALGTPGKTRFLILRIVAPIPLILSDGLPYGYVSGPVDQDATEQVVAEARHEVEREAVELEKTSDCAVERGVVVAEHAGQAIVEFARSSGADLIAMTTHGRGASRLLLGSVTDSVLRSSDLPMLVLRPSRD